MHMKGPNHGPLSTTGRSGFGGHSDRDEAQQKRSKWIYLTEPLFQTADMHCCFKPQLVKIGKLLPREEGHSSGKSTQVAKLFCWKIQKSLTAHLCEFSNGMSLFSTCNIRKVPRWQRVHIYSRVSIFKSHIYMESL